MYFVYILESIKLNKLYIVYTKDLVKRMLNHNKGKQRWTRRGVPWKMICNIGVETKKEAIVLEKRLKKYKNPKHLKKLIIDGSIAQLARALT